MPCRGSTSRHSAITRSSPWPSSVPLPDAAEDRSQLPQTDLGPLSVHRILSPLCSKRVGDPVQVRAALLSPQEPCQELASQVDVPTFRDGVARQPRSHPLNSDSLILKKSAACFASMTSLPLASAPATYSRIAASRRVSRLVSWWPRTPFSLPSPGLLCRISWVTSWSRPRRPSESRFSGLRMARPERPTPVTFLSDPDKLAEPKAELQEKLLQIEEFEGRARQDSNLRPSDS